MSQKVEITTTFIPTLYQLDEAPGGPSYHIAEGRTTSMKEVEARLLLNGNLTVTVEGCEVTAHIPLAPLIKGAVEALTARTAPTTGSERGASA